MTWRECALGDVITLKRGHDLPKSKRAIGSVPVISSSGITGSHNEAKALPPGVVTGRYGTIGKVFFVEEPYWPHNTALYVIDFKGNDPRFVAYLLRNTLRDYKTEKAAVPGVDRNVLHTLRVRNPNANTQSTIASILSAYDDLIDNNWRRIALMEKAACLLYREWFVHFRFPGHEHVKIIDGVPKGWIISSASAVMEVLSGGTPKTNNPTFWNGDIGFFTPKDVTDAPFVIETEKTISEEGLRACNSKLYPSGTVFITARGTVGKLSIALKPMAMNQSCYALRSKVHLNQRHLFLALKSAIEQVRTRATGAVFNAIIVATFDDIPFTLPPKRLTDLFAGHIEPIFDQIGNLILQNKKLAQARDILLPRLMSGKIIV